MFGYTLQNKNVRQIKIIKMYKVVQKNLTKNIKNFLALYNFKEDVIISSMALYVIYSL